MITLDCRPSSLLDFKGGRLEALQNIAKGEPVKFYLDFGLESLSPQQIPAAALALDHFFETLWPEFQNYIETIYLYSGSFPTDDKAFSDKLKRLTAKVSVEVPMILDFRTQDESSLEIARKCLKSLYSRYQVLVDSKQPPFCSMESTVGFLLPSAKDFEFQALHERGVDLRVIEDEFLIADWHGLNYLLVDPEFLDHESVRKLKGFQAAGGGVVSLGDPLGLEDEIAFDRQMPFPHR